MQVLRARTCEGAAKNGINLKKKFEEIPLKIVHCRRRRRHVRNIQFEMELKSAKQWQWTVLIDLTAVVFFSLFASPLALLAATNRAHYSIFLNETRMTRRKQKKKTETIDTRTSS